MLSFYPKESTLQGDLGNRFLINFSKVINANTPTIAFDIFRITVLTTCPDNEPARKFTNSIIMPHTALARIMPGNSFQAIRKYPITMGNAIVPKAIRGGVLSNIANHVKNKDNPRTK